MVETDTGDAAQSRKSVRGGLVIALCLSLAGGAAAFAATYLGVFDPILARFGQSGAASASELDLAYVPIEPMVISLDPDSKNRHLRFAAELEVMPSEKANVAKLMPRVLDTLNGYLRAVRPSDLAEPAQMIRIRSHMLHRVRMVTGGDRVRDLLVTEFVLS